jgi:hypothetical protein
MKSRNRSELLDHPKLFTVIRSGGDVANICGIRAETQINPRSSDLRGHVARYHVFEENKKDVRIEIPTGQIHKGNPGHRFKGTGGNRSFTLRHFHKEESVVLELKLPEARKEESTTVIDSRRNTSR